SGLLLVALLLLILSSSILRNGKSLWLLLLIVAAITVLLWRTFTRVYSKAQFAVQEAFVGAPSESKATHPLPGILKEAEMETIVLASAMVATNKLISDIQRTGATLINPEPHEELLPGDDILLIGRPEQLSAAKSFLTTAQTVAKAE